LPICIASDEKVDVECDYFILISDPKFGYQDKVLNMDKTPFQETVFLDSDMSFFHCPDVLFDGLGGADLLVSHEVSLGLGPVSQNAMIPDAFPEVNSGLIVYRKNDVVLELLKNWRKEYDSMYALYKTREDQPSLRRALFFTKIKFSILPPEFHYIPANFMRVVGKEIYCVHNHNFDFSNKIGTALNARPMGDYSGYVDGLGVFRNPYAMQFKEVLQFTLRCFRLLPYLLMRALYISIRKKWRRKTQ
jgi:hypothetical protein